MKVQLPRVEIPGYADAIRRERTLRDASFLEAYRDVCGFKVRLMTLRDAIWLDHARNGFVVPCRFDDQHEAYAHALTLLWQLHPAVRMPRAGGHAGHLWRLRVEAIKVWTFVRGLWQDEAKVIAGVVAYLEDRYFDAPRSGDADNPAFAKAYASGAASVVDLLAAGGYCMSEDEILDLPLDRLWQYGRLVTQRLGGKVANPSDWIAARFMEQQQGGRK